MGDAMSRSLSLLEWYLLASACLWYLVVVAFLVVFASAVTSWLWRVSNKRSGQ